MKLRTQFTLGFSLVALLGVGVTGGLLISYSYERALVRLKDQQLLLAENRASAISQEVAEEVARIRYLSTLTDIDLTDENLEPEKAVLRHALHDPHYFSIETSAVNPQGVVQWTEPHHDGPTVPVQAGNQPWFQEVKRHPEHHTDHHPSESFVFEDVASDSPRRIRLVVPLWSGDGSFAGCLTSTLDPSTTAHWGERLRVDLGQSGTAAIVDREGHTVVSLGASEGPDFDGRSHAITEALAGHEVSDWAKDSDGRAWLLTTVPLPNTGWALMLRQARDELDDDLDPELRTFAWLLLAVLSGALTLGALYARSLARPVTTLARVAREVERGRFEGVPAPSRRDELGDLERAFFSMTATLEAKVEERTRALEQAQAQLVEQGRFAAMGKTAAAIAHELKNALNGLGVAVELLTQGKLPATSQEPIREQVRSEIERLRDITDNLNIFAGSPKLACSPHDLRTLVDRAIASQSDRIDAADIDLVIDVPSSLPAVTCDGQKLQGVLINLLKNAVEAVEPGIEGPPPENRHQITIAARPVDNRMELEVIDTGPGIAADVAHHLFEPFFTTKRTGTGLGLVIGRKLVEAHGGSLSWQPNQPHGTRMQIHLPLQTAAANEPSSPSSPSSSKPQLRTETEPETQPATGEAEPAIAPSERGVG